MTFLQSKRACERGLTFGKVVIIDSDVFGRQVCGNLVLPPSLCFQLQIVSAGHATRLVAGVDHMAPAFNFGGICILQTHRATRLPRIKSVLLVLWVAAQRPSQVRLIKISQEKLLGHFVQSWKCQRHCSCYIPGLQMALQEAE